MNRSTYRLVSELGRHLIAIGKELLRWRDSQPGVLTDENFTEFQEPTGRPSPPASLGHEQARSRDGTARR